MIEEKKLKVRDGKSTIHYLKSGTGSTTVLMLHGWCINAHYWESQIAVLANTLEVYALDLPGFGESSASRENWTIEEYALDVLAFIEELNLDNVVVVAHSMSGAIMMEMAIRNTSSTIIGLIGVDNFKFIDVELTPEQMEQMGSFFPLLETDFKTYAPSYAEMLFHPSTKEEVKTRVKTDFAKADPFIGYQTFMNLMEYSGIEATRLESLPTKLHIINCDFAPINETGLKNHLRTDFEIQTISNSGHYPMLEQPEAFNHLLLSMIQVIDKTVTLEDENN